MKICMIIDAWDPIVGGGQNHVKNLLGKLVSDYSCSVDLFVRDLPGNHHLKDYSPYKGLRIIKIGPKLPFFNLIGRLAWFISPIAAIIKENKKNQYDLIHAHAYFSAIPAKIASLILKKPIIYTVHGSNLMDSSGTFIRKNIETFLLTGIKYNAEITVSSNFLKYKNVNKNIQVIPNGVNVDAFKLLIKKDKSKFKALFVGRFDKIKGVEILLKSIRILKKNSAQLLTKKNVEFNFIGYGYEENTLKKITKTYELDDLVNFLGEKKWNEVITEYLKSNLFILPSLAEGQPLTLLEAWAAKLPVVVTLVGENENIVDEGRNGYLTKPNNPEALAEKIEMAINNDNLKTMGERGYEKVLQNYTWDKVAGATFKLYSQIVIAR